MNAFWFVVFALVLLPAALGIRLVEAALMRWEIRLDRLSGTLDAEATVRAVLKHVVKVQSGYSGALAVRMTMLTLFGMLAVGLACLAVFRLPIGWGVVYVVLALLGIALLRMGAAEQPPTATLGALILVACMLWVAMHLAGMTHFTVPSFHVDFRTPGIDITIH